VTLSIVARSVDARMFGMAIASSSPAVAARCSHARTGVGAVASQNITDPALGPQILAAMSDGACAADAMARVMATAKHASYRQVLAIGIAGPPAAHSGGHALGVVRVALGTHAAAAGNLLANAEVPQAMVTAFDAAVGHLGSRLLCALRAGAARGGEAGPLHSAGLLVVRDVAWPLVDLRVDWADAEPIESLTSIWDRYAPQMEDYVRRALDPAGAPSFGVPGNL
jgi:uncharacterized Ntn-hydrolase superfamily protein